MRGNAQFQRNQNAPLYSLTRFHNFCMIKRVDDVS